MGDAPERVAANRVRLARAAGFAPGSVAWVDQVHGAAVLAVDAPGCAGPADALVTDRSGVTLAIGVADCVAVYLLDPPHHALGLCHAGWRGTVADVVGQTLAKMGQRYGTRPADLLAALGPAIGPCCYEVDDAVAGALRAAVPWAETVLAPSRPGHPRLDLWAANRRRLEDRGVLAARIRVAGICTACQPGLLFSHRRDHGQTGRMRAVLWYRP